MDREVSFFSTRDGRNITYKAVTSFKWRPDEYRFLTERIREYKFQIREGEARNVREAVKMLTKSRREWVANEAAQRAPGIRKRAERRLRASGYERSLPYKKRMVLASGRPCSYCGIPNPRTVDHIVPTSRGGGHQWWNLAECCLSCNSEKGGRTPDEWKALRLAKGLPWPPVRTGCPKCGNTGRTSSRGVEHHCGCPIGRRMAVAHWNAKASEEANA